MRRLGTNRRNRSASIAFPGDGGGGGGARSNENSNLNVTADKSKSRQDSPPLTLTRSERHYQSAGNVRNWTASDLEDISVDSWHSYHLRRFSVTTKGVVSRGDYLRYRRIRSRSLVPGAASELPCSATILEASGSDDSGISHQTDVKKSQDSYIVSKTGSNLSTNGSNNCEASLATLQLEIEEFGVYLVGSSGVGKTALAQQFATSEHILNFRTKGKKDLCEFHIYILKCF